MRFLFLCALAGIFWPADGWSAELIFAQSAPLSGPAQAMGQQMRTGIRAAFLEANRAGGIAGRNLVLETLDDQYEPELTIKNAQHFIARDNVIAMIGGVGTPTSRAVLSLVEAAGIAYVAPVTGAAALRKPEHKAVLNVRASYNLEVLRIVEWLAHSAKAARIGILYQDDSYGLAGLAALQDALAGKRIQLVGAAPYLRNTAAVKQALLNLEQAAPEAVLIVSTYQAAAAFVRWARKIGFTPLFINLSFVSSDALAAELGAEVAGIYVSQVVPSPQQHGSRLVEKFRAAMVDFDGGVALTYQSLEGYLAGRVAVELLHRLEGGINRGSFLNAVQTTAELQVEDFYVPLSDRQGARRVYLTVADRSGRFVPVP